MFDAAAYLQQTRRHGSSRSRWQLRGQVQELPPGRAGQTVQTQVLSRLVLRVVFQAQILNSTQLDESTATTTNQSFSLGKKGQNPLFWFKMFIERKIFVSGGSGGIENWSLNLFGFSPWRLDTSTKWVFIFLLHPPQYDSFKRHTKQVIFKNNNHFPFTWREINRKPVGQHLHNQYDQCHSEHMKKWKF